MVIAHYLPVTSDRRSVAPPFARVQETKTGGGKKPTAKNERAVARRFMSDAATEVAAARPSCSQRLTGRTWDADMAHV